MTCEPSKTNQDTKLLTEHDDMQFFPELEQSEQCDDRLIRAPIVSVYSREKAENAFQNRKILSVADQIGMLCSIYVMIFVMSDAQTASLAVFSRLLMDSLKHILLVVLKEVETRWRILETRRRSFSTDAPYFGPMKIDLTWNCLSVLSTKPYAMYISVL